MKKSNEKVLGLFKELEKVKNSNLNDETLLKIVSLMKERASFIEDIYNDSKFFFEVPISYDEKASKKAWNEETGTLLKEFSVILSEVEESNFKPETLKQSIHDFAEAKGLGMGKVMMPLRLSLVGELKGPDVPDIMNILGKEQTIERISDAIDILK